MAVGELYLFILPWEAIATDTTCRQTSIATWCISAGELTIWDSINKSTDLKKQTKHGTNMTKFGCKVMFLNPTIHSGNYMLCRVIPYKLAGVSKLLTASIIRTMSFAHRIRMIHRISVIISLHSINQMMFVMEMFNFIPVMNWIFKYYLDGFKGLKTICGWK
jgi:hypothetical protein